MNPLQRSCSLLAHRSHGVARGREHVCTLLPRLFHGSIKQFDSFFTYREGQTPPKAKVMFFPGQGTQRPQMLYHLQKALPQTVVPLLELLDRTVAASDAAYKGNHLLNARPLSDIIANGPHDLLTRTENAQPAILFTSLLLHELLKKRFTRDVKFDYYLGHSLGEFTALVAAGIMKMEDAIALVRRRGIGMSECSEELLAADDGNDQLGMYAIIAEAEHLAGVIETINAVLAGTPLAIMPEKKVVQIANHNTPTQIVLSGHISAIQSLICHIRKFSGHDPRAIRLPVSAPFHTPLMQPVVPIIAEQLESIELNWKGRKGDVISNITGRPYRSEKEIRDLLPKQAVEKVLCAESIKYLEEEVGISMWVGIGPGASGLKGLLGDVRGRVFTLSNRIGPKQLGDTANEICE